MKRLAMSLGLAAALILSACEQREQSGVATQPRTEREGQLGGESARPPASSDQTATQPTTGESPMERDTLARSSTERPATGEEARPDTGLDSKTAQSTGRSERSDDLAPGASAQGSRPGTAQGGRESSEFYGQGPKFGNAPETVVLEAANGNVTLSHKKHAGMTDCKTCHGDATPGPIEAFNKDQAHSLCTGCHKEKGAGPTKCQECHKKQ